MIPFLFLLVMVAQFAATVLVFAELRHLNAMRAFHDLEMERHMMHIKTNTASLSGTLSVMAMRQHTSTEDDRQGSLKDS